MTIAVTAGPAEAFCQISEPGSVFGGDRQFTPNWVHRNDGDGIVALCHHTQFHRCRFGGLHEIGQTLWAEPTFCSSRCSAWLIATALDLLLNQARRIFGHAVMSMFFAPIRWAGDDRQWVSGRFGIPLWGQSAVEIRTYPLVGRCGDGRCCAG